MPYIEDDNGDTIFVANEELYERGRIKRRRNEEIREREDRERDRREERRDDREDKKDDKRDYKLDKLDAQADKSRATAEKRKSLVSLIKWFLIAVGVLYGIFKLGGLNIGGIIEKIRGVTG